MKAFTITETQIERVVGAVFADELSRQFNRHFDFLTTAGWDGDTALGFEGLKLSDKEREACVKRALEFFGVSNAEVLTKPTAKISEIAEAISSEIKNELLEFSFKSAARNETRAESRHNADEIFQDAAAAANIFYGRRRMLSFVAPHSLLGFALTILTPNLQGIETVDARGMTPDELSETLAYGDVLVATPTLWRYIIRENLSAPDNTMAVSFGEVMAPDLSTDMRKAGFGVLRELYGSTESGLMGWRDSPTEPFLLFDHWRRDGDDVYRLTPGGQERLAPAMDFLDWSGDRAFSLSGRRDGAVQIGAVNVQPEEVARQLAQHPAIQQCAVKAGQSGDGVMRLTANIVLKKKTTPDERIVRDIDAWCRTSLRQQERPRIYQFHDSLPQ